MLQYLVFLGVTAQLIGTVAYIRGTIKGDIRPNRVTWLLWAIAPIVGTAAAFSDGVRLAAIPVFMAGFGPLLVFLSSFVNPKSYWKLETFDYLCGAFSIIALVLWYITKQPLVAIGFCILSDGFAAIPTLVKSWNHPDTERVTPFFGGLFSNITSFFAIKTWTPTSYAFPVYFVAINICLIMAIIGKRLVKRVFI